MKFYDEEKYYFRDSFKDVLEINVVFELRYIRIILKLEEKLIVEFFFFEVLRLINIYVFK